MGGTEARLGQFPWGAYLSVRGPDIDKMCAGTLIADRSGRGLSAVLAHSWCIILRYVLTAGHCVDFCSMKISPGCRRTDPFPRISIKVSLGEHNHGGEVGPVQRYHVTRVTIHPNFTNELHTRPDGYIEASDRYRQKC